MSKLRCTSVVRWVVALALSACAQAPISETACGLDDAKHERVTTLVKRIVERGQAPGVVADIRCEGKP